ncbi:hypothetical protein B1218_36230, partial [Pseudomonas ogarae]
METQQKVHGAREQVAHGRVGEVDDRLGVFGDVGAALGIELDGGVGMGVGAEEIARKQRDLGGDDGG